MKTLAAIDAFHSDMTEWRHDFHRHPELSFEEKRTSGIVAEKLRRFGLAPVEGIGGTGVVAVVDSGRPGQSIALRADMDALPMDDLAGTSYHSHIEGVAHTCGHDGHTASLLGVARWLADNPPASGKVVLIFQPAEENGLGAQAMIADGLLERFPFDEVYAFHNMPLLEPGQAGVSTGPTLNGYIIWDITIAGEGGHGAAFFKATDPLQAAARLASEISSIVGRYLDPAEAGLITVCSMQAGSSHNIIPASASLGGTLRAVKPEVIDLLYTRLEKACEGIAAMSGCTITCKRLAEVPPCVNAPEGAARAAQACAEVVGADNVLRDHSPFPFTDDFALFLQAAPGAYMFFGQNSAMCHNPAYDFDDTLLPVAASIFARLIQQRLG
ncbi:amidohydrolase [Altericroceibacterium spongiae]|uniref:Amidohydrolase n=1 Tax=Altericroceibacterium spongiae TaxID=2320269 RepID=A0A420EAD2_9SPHN|nr:amidohydrolase [Altericroceibacterium spongiae]RKF17625.1 amidohydrolase [Altericroceibacterium spongiae]